MSKLIGLCGKAGAGKDHVMLDLWQRFPETKRIAFADGVREEAEDILKTTVVWDKPYPPEVRGLLQWWGTELRRAQDPDYWVKYAAPKILASLNRGNLVAVTDVRFANEAQLIRDMGGIVIEVYADDDIRLERLGGVDAAGHASEVLDFETDGVIVNNTATLYPPVVCEHLGMAYDYGTESK